MLPTPTRTSAPALTGSPERIALPPGSPTGRATTPTTTRPATPAGRRADGSLLHIGTLDGRAGIVTTDADGRGRRVLVAGEYDAIAWDPHGYRYAATGPLLAGRSSRVAIFGADGAPLDRYPFDGTAGQLLWSPDSSRLAVAMTPVSPVQPGPTETWQLATWGELRRATVPVAGAVAPVAWTPAGVLIVTTHDDISRLRTLRTVSAAGTHAVREVAGDLLPLGLSPDGETLYALEAAPTLAPDGAHLAVVIERAPSAAPACPPTQPTRTLVLLWPDGTIMGTFRLPDGTWPSRLAWSPNGTLLAFFAGVGAANPRFIVVGTGGTQWANAAHSLPALLGDQLASWSPDSRRLAYVGRNGITVIGLNGNHTYQFTPVGDAPCWRPERRP